MVAIGIITVMAYSNVPKTKTQYWIERLELNKKRDFLNKSKID